MKQLPDDGLIHRFIPVILNSPNWDAQGDAREAQALFDAMLRYLHQNMPGAIIQMSPEARDLFEAERKHKAYLSDCVYESSPQLASHLGKHGGMLARIALTFHACSEPNSKVLSAETMGTAIRFMRHVAKHAAAMFDGILGTSEPLALARALGRSIVAEGSVLNTSGATG
jgi:hypothetical protein